MQHELNYYQNYIIKQDNIIYNQLNVKPNDTIKINFVENPTTGFCWNAEYSKQYVSLKQDYFNLEQPNQNNIIVGNGGIRTFIFNINNSYGTTEIKFSLQKIWENLEQALVNINIKINICKD